MAPENCYIDEHVLQKGETQDTNKAYITCKTGIPYLDVTWNSLVMILLWFLRNMPEMHNIRDHFAVISY
jgi:hypothetical protein